MLKAATFLLLVTAMPSLAVDKWLTLGTSGGPSVQAERTQISNALVMNDAFTCLMQVMVYSVSSKRPD